MPGLPCVTEEVRDVVTSVRRGNTVSISHLDGATKREVVELLDCANIVHFACHGIQHSSEPHQSHFCLTDGKLTVSELMAMELKDPFLAFLSACETAKGDRRHADEALHLAATMLFAGFKSVVATMW
jgi:CHAT domain-containing protein